MKNKQFIESHYQQAIELLMELGKIPAPSHHEEKRAQFVYDWFIKHQAKNVIIDEAKNVICKIEGKKKEIVVLMAHTDVVFEDTTPLPMVLEGDLLKCPGIGDDTANLINLLMGYLYLVENHIIPEYTLLIVANSCEEGLGNLKGSKAIIEKYEDQIAYFYSFDGYLPGITNRAVGSYRYSITIQTEGGHSYGAFGNANAIVEMSRLILELDHIDLPKKAKTTYNVGVIEGGSTVNSIAQECTILYEFRSEDEECLEYMKQKLDTIITFYQNKGINITIKTLGIRPGSKLDDLDALEAFTLENIDMIKKYTDGKVALHAGSTDANIPLSKGMLANTIGTVKGRYAHTREEYIELSSLKTGMNIVLDVIKKYC